MTGFRVRWSSAAVLVVVSLTALLVVAGCGSGSSRSSTEGTAASDQPTVKLGGYTFASNSNVLTHPYFTANASTPREVLKGWGSEKGKQMTISFSSGGLVRNVATLKLTLTLGPANQYRCLAQDSQGNIHYLKSRDGTGPVRYEGVAAGLPPSFFLVRDARLTVGYVWYNYFSPGVKDAQQKVISRTATWRGMSKLLLCREVDDSNHDGVFDPSWGGPDHRSDHYSGTSGHGGGVQTSATGGYAP